VPGTGLLLDTPEAIDAWLTERKKRYPSKENIEAKKRKAQEAAERGEIDLSGLTANSRKRRRVDGSERKSGPPVPARQSGGAPTKNDADTLADPHRCRTRDTNVRNILSSGVSSDSNSDMDPVKDAVSSKTYQDYPQEDGMVIPDSPRLVTTSATPAQMVSKQL
jgi:hypothetical protein